MKTGTGIILCIVLAAGCGKHNNNTCSLPVFACLQGKWIEKEHTAGNIQVKEYIEVYVEKDRPVFYDGTVYAQLQMSPLAVGKYYFGELPGMDSIALTPVYAQQTYHRYLKMIGSNEIEIDYELPPAPPVMKKKYIRE